MRGGEVGSVLRLGRHRAGLGKGLGTGADGRRGRGALPLDTLPAAAAAAAVTSDTSAAASPAAAVPLDAAAAAAAPVAGAHVRPVARLRLTHSESQPATVLGTLQLVQLVQLVVVEAAKGGGRPSGGGGGKAKGPANPFALLGDD